VLTPLGRGLGPLGVTARRATVTRALSLVRASGQQVTSVDNPSLSTGNVDFTFAAWVYVQTLPSSILFPGIVAKYSASNNREFALYHTGDLNRFVFVIYNAAGTQIAAVTASNFGSVPIGQWIFVVAWHDAAADTLNIQINNGPVNSAATGGAGPADTTATFRVGYFGAATYYWDGRIDELAFWKRTLTAGERTTLYGGGTGITYAQAAALTTNLISWWSLDEETGNRLDSHGANHLSPINNPTVADGVSVPSAGYVALLRGHGAAGIWMLDESLGNALDSSGNGRDLTLVGAPTRQQAGPLTLLPYAAASFAATRYFHSSDANLRGTGPLTVGAWVRTNATISTLQYALARDVNLAGANRAWSYGLSGSKLTFSDDGSGSAALAQGAFALPDKWFFSVATFEPATAVRLYQDGTLDASDLTSIPAALADVAAAFTVGRRATAASEAPWLGRLAGAFVVNDVLSAAEIRELYHAVTNHARLIWFDGDSLTVGFNVTPPWTDALVAALPGYSTYYNIAVSGQPLSTLNANSPAKIDHLYDESVPGIVCIWCGINDIVAGADAATTYSRLVTYCQGRQAAGYQVVVSTLLPCTSASAIGVGYNAKRNTVNASIRANWATFADALADVAADTRIGDDADSDDLVYFNADKTHLNATGYAIVSGIVDTAIRSLP
jgi:hypothetical protein